MLAQGSCATGKLVAPVSPNTSIEVWMLLCVNEMLETELLAFLLLIGNIPNKCKQTTLKWDTYTHAIGPQVFNNAPKNLHTKVYVHGHLMNCVVMEMIYMLHLLVLNTINPNNQQTRYCIGNTTCAASGDSIFIKASGAKQLSKSGPGYWLWHQSTTFDNIHEWIQIKYWFLHTHSCWDINNAKTEYQCKKALGAGRR